MASQDDILNMDYDTESDVLYVSLGPPQASLSYEIAKDIWLDCLPPHRAVIGMTIINFLRHYPIEDRAEVFSAGRTVVKTLLQRYPSVPMDEAMQTTRTDTRDRS
jgi:uncharacterized protein YuzE